MRKILMILSTLFLGFPAAQADTFDIIQLNQLRLDYINFLPGGREPIITSNGLKNRELGQMLDLRLESTIFDYFYWNNTIHSYTDAFRDDRKGQYRSVGLNMELGLRALNFLDIYYWHYSNHVLDHKLPNRFPLQDGIGVHIYFYSDTRKDSLIHF